MNRRIGLLAASLLAVAGCVEPLPPQEAVEAAPVHSHVEEPLFVNSSFETGNLTSWTVTTWLTPGTGVTAYPVTAESQLGLTAGGVLKTMVPDAGAPYAYVPPGLTAADPPRYPRFGYRAAVVNELGKNNNANKITQSSVVTTADIDPADGLVHVRFTVLPVLQNPGHTVIEQPFYFVSVANVTKGTTLTSRFNFSNEAGVPWQSNAAGTIVFTDWLLFDLPLARNAVSIGDTLSATIIAGGCAPGGHWGEAIVDAFGSSIPGLVVYGSGPDSVEAGTDFQYAYRVLNGGTTTTTGTRMTAYLPAGVTFRSIDTPGVTCTLPVVGTRGTVVCDLGAVPAGGSQLIKITVRADATATGVIRHGWYFSQSNQDQALTGPLVSTNVTTGGTTQYVDLVTTVVDAASSVAWGQHNTWSITVRNDGSATATAAGITTNTPAQLSNLAWTCTAQAGASCALAAGSGALNTNATIPAGKSVTWTFEADVIAGSGTGVLSFTALATAPVGTVERYSLDNGSGDDDTIAGSVVSVTVNRAGAGSGSIVSSPAGLTCGSGCTTTSATFANGTQVTLQAVPASGSVFAGWSGGTCTGTAACTFNAAAGQTLTATFTANAIAITSPATAAAAVGRPFSYTVTAIGTAPIALGATNLPGWLSFDAATGVLSGTPPAGGTFTVNLSATDVNGTATLPLLITAGLAPTITSATTFIVPTGTAWQSSTPAVIVTATGDATISFNVSNLPGLVYFNSTTGAFTGAAGADGVFNVPVIATNPYGSDYKVLAISVGGAPVITSALASAATVGTPWTYTLTATGTATITYSVSSLPAWASYNAATHVISGTPTSAGTVSIGLRATNGVGFSQQSLILTIAGPAVITSGLAASGTAGQAFSYSLTAEGSAPITRTMTGLPAWATFDAATGLLSGTPPAAGSFTVTMGASNGVGSDSRTLTITIAAPPPTPTPPVITSALTAPGALTVPFSYTLTASGQVPMTFSASGLPAWASFNATTGVISGTPNATGLTNVTLGATNALGSDSQVLVIDVPQPAAITSALVATGVVGQAFSYTLTASGSAPLTLSATSLPGWASFNAGSGVLSGTPTAEGTFSISLGASNAAGSDGKTLVITVRTVPAITSALTASGVVGQAFSYTLTSSGTAPLTLSATSLPAWASFNAATGVISGTPTADGTFNVALGSSNAAGSDAKTLVLTIRTGAAITSALTASGVVGQAFSYTLTASGTAPLTLSATSLPAWASFNAATGVLSGTPTADGAFNVALGASNTAATDSKTLVLTVRTVPAITSALTASGVVGQAFNYTLTSSGTAPLTLTATSLPAWASFNAATGALSGTPTADGTFNVALGSSNAAGSDSKTLVLTVRTTTAITSALTASGVVGQPFSYTLTASGTAPVTLTATNLPAWASFNAATGVLSGTPTADGTFNVALGSSNAAGSDSKTLVLTVRTTPSINSVLATAAVVGAPFSYTLTSSGTGPLTFSTDALPSWLSFDAATGVLSGTPPAEGTTSVTLHATNAAGTSTQTLVITARSTPVITNALQAYAVVGGAFTFTLTATGSPTIAFTTTGLPAGLSLSGAVLSGTPTAAGTFQVTETATNSAGQHQVTVTLSVRPVIPAPSITLPAEDAVLGSGQVTVSGTAPSSEAGNTVHVTEGGATVCDAVIQADGTWSCAVTLPEATHTLSAVIVDVHGFVGTQADTQRFTIDLTLPAAPAWTGPASSALLTDATPELSGTGEPGATVSVTRGGQPVCSALVQPDGTWRCTPTTALPEGPVTLSLSQRDAAGNQGPAVERTFTIDSLAPLAPTITAPGPDALLQDASPLLSGTAEPLSTVKLFVDGVQVCTAQADASGHYECRPSSPLAQGPHTLEAMSVDAAGNESPRASSTFRVDSLTPAAPVISGPTGRVTTASPTVEGSAEPGSTVTVTLDGQPLCVTTADASGHWSCPTSGLAGGTHTVTATARDAAGNVSPATTGSFEVQTATGTVTPPPPSPSTDNPHLEGEATPNSTVNVYIDGKLAGTTTSDANGHWSLDVGLQTAGEHPVSIGVVGADGTEVFHSTDQVLVIEKPGIDFGGGIGCSSTSGAPVGVLALVAIAFFSRRRRALAAATVLAMPALAQVAMSNFELEQLTLNPSARGGLVVGGADLLAPKDFRIAASLGYQYAPLKYFENGVLKAIPVEHRLTAVLSGAVAVLPWLEVGATVPVVLYQGGTPALSRSGDMVLSSVPTQVSLGTPWLQGRMAVLQERNGSPLDLGLSLMLGLPFGSSPGLTREGTVSGQVLAGAGRTFKGVRIAAEVGAHLRPGTTLVADSTDAVGSRVLINAGASTVGGALRGELSVRTFVPLTAQPVSAELLVGLRYAFQDWELFAIGGPGFGNAPGTPMFRAVLGASFGGVKSARCGGRDPDPAQCPGLDADGDGVANGDDACPLVRAATANGCLAVAVAPVVVPEAVAPVVAKVVPAVVAPVEEAPQVVLKDDHLELRGSVYFDTAKATLQARSFPLLDEVVKVMKDHPEVKYVSVEGHTDAQGSAGFNLRLSGARARAVKVYLEKAGIAPKRLGAKGYGHTKPIASSATEEGRAKNRRVEFIVLQ